MKYLDLEKYKGEGCSFFFAVEEFLIKNQKYDEDIFMLWSVPPTVMVGRNQLTNNEINFKYVKDNNINVIRRNSGGGCVYTDPLCLQFSYVSKDNKDKVFNHYSGLMINILNSLDVSALLSGRNDIVVDGKKFSGNAFFKYKEYLVYHGTLLFDTDLNQLANSLNPSKAKLSSKGVKSVRQRVVNLKEYVDMNIDEFYKYIISNISDEKITLSESDIFEVRKLEDKFLDDLWNYGKNPPYTIIKKGKYRSGNFELNILLKNNVIKNMSINGDFFALKEVDLLSRLFKGVEFEEFQIKDIIKKIDVSKYILNFTNEEFLNLLFGEE